MNISLENHLGVLDTMLDIACLIRKHHLELVIGLGKFSLETFETLDELVNDTHDSDSLIKTKLDRIEQIISFLQPFLDLISCNR